MDRIITCGQVRKFDGDRLLCDLRAPNGVEPDFPVFRAAFQVPPTDAGAKIAFMAWETREDPKTTPLFGKIQLHQSACVIPPERHEELSRMTFEEASDSLSRKEFYTLCLISG